MISEKKRQEFWEEQIKNYVESNEIIKSRRQMYDSIVSKLKEKAEKTDFDYPEYEIVQSTFYKYLTLMKFKKMPNGKYGFADEDSVFLDNLITLKRFDSQLYFQLTDSNYGLVIANLINRNHSFGENFHCVVLQDLLICYYQDSEDNKLESEIIKFVNAIAKKYVLYNCQK